MKLLVRAWDKENKCMIYQDDIYPNSIYKFEFDFFKDNQLTLTKLKNKTSFINKYGDECIYNEFEYVDADIMIGFEKDGNKYFEKDITSHPILTHKSSDKGIIEFDEEKAKFYTKSLFEGYYCFGGIGSFGISNVIGNIYENEDLLEG